MHPLLNCVLEISGSHLSEHGASTVFLASTKLQVVIFSQTVFSCCLIRHRKAVLSSCCLVLGQQTDFCKDVKTE